jgi:hypothetical protein
MDLVTISSIAPQGVEVVPDGAERDQVHNSHLLLPLFAILTSLFVSSLLKSHLT